MLVCDRCNKEASVSRNLVAASGTDLCVRCDKDLADVLAAFLTAKPFSIAPPDVAQAATASDPPADNVKVG